VVERKTNPEISEEAGQWRVGPSARDQGANQGRLVTDSREEPAMYVISDTDLRELDSRSNDGIVVTLLWSPQANRVWVSVVD
jgi:hypothetical protein